MLVFKKDDMIKYKGFLIKPESIKKENCRVIVYSIEKDHLFDFVFKHVNSAKNFIDSLV